MKNIGQVLQLRRKELNITLKEVENATSIRMVYLQALEDGDSTRLISPVYAQGFLKQYAAYLGIDGDKLVREHPEHFIRPPAQEFAYGIGTLEARGNPGAGVKWFPNALWVALFALLLFIAWYVARSFEVI